MAIAVVGLSGGVGSDTRPPAPLTQLTSNVGGVSDPFVDVSRTLQRVTTSVRATPKP